MLVLNKIFLKSLIYSGIKGRTLRKRPHMAQSPTRERERLKPFLILKRNYKQRLVPLLFHGVRIHPSRQCHHVARIRDLHGLRELLRPGSVW